MKILYTLVQPFLYGFDELGEHGILDVNLEKNILNINFVKLDEQEFEEKEINISDINTEEELIEKINDEKFDDNNFYKIILIGNKKIEINRNRIIKILNRRNIIKIKDKTQFDYDIEKIIQENNLRGFFIREILEMKNSNNYSEDEINKSIEIGLNALKN